MILICNQTAAPEEYWLMGAILAHCSELKFQPKDRAQAMQTNSSQHCRFSTTRAGCKLFLSALSLAVFCRFATPAAAEPATPIHPPLTDEQNLSGSKTETAVFAGGCFWGVQAVFQHTKGVTSAVSGYAGGTPVAPVTSRSAPAARGTRNPSKSRLIRRKSPSATYSRSIFRWRMIRRS